MPRSYAHDVSVGEKKNALKAVLSRRFAEERIVVLDRMDLESHRTRDLKAAVDTLGIEGKALFVDVGARTRTSCAPRATSRTGSSSIRWR